MYILINYIFQLWKRIPKTHNLVDEKKPSKNVFMNVLEYNY